MRHQAKLLAICGALALALAGPGCMVRSYTFKDAPSPDKPLDVLVRGFLVKGKETGRFDYRAYLVFSENSEVTRARREAATHAFARLLDDVKDYSAPDDKPERLAILYAPVTSEDLGPKSKPEEILEAYDYLFAQRVTGQLARQRTVPPVYLLGSAAPIQEALVTPGSDLWVVELKGDQQSIESTITGFRDRLLNPGQSLSGKEMVKRVLAFFDSVGGFVIAVATLGSGTSPSKP